MFLVTVPSTLIRRTAGPATARTVHWRSVNLETRVRSPTGLFGVCVGKSSTGTFCFPSVPFHQCSVLTTHLFLTYAIQSQQMARPLNNTSPFKADIIQFTDTVSRRETGFDLGSYGAGGN